MPLPLAPGALERFEELALRLPQLLESLRHCVPLGRSADGAPDRPGVYVLSERGTPLYVGQTRRLRRRLRQHGGRASRENQAVFAFAIAKREAASAGLSLDGVTRRALAQEPRFVEIFRQARERVAAMDVRFVEIDDPELRTVFEVYAAVALGTLEYNSFETH